MKAYTSKMFDHVNGNKYKSHVVYLVRVYNDTRLDFRDLFICSTIDKAFELIKRHIFIEPIYWIFNKPFSLEVVEYHVDIANINNSKTFYSMVFENDMVSAIVDYSFIDSIPTFFKTLIEN